MAKTKEVNIYVATSGFFTRDTRGRRAFIPQGHIAVDGDPVLRENKNKFKVERTLRAPEEVVPPSDPPAPPNDPPSDPSSDAGTESAEKETERVVKPETQEKTRVTRKAPRK